MWFMARGAEDALVGITRNLEVGKTAVGIDITLVESSGHATESQQQREARVS